MRIRTRKMRVEHEKKEEIMDESLRDYLKRGVGADAGDPDNILRNLFLFLVPAGMQVLMGEWRIPLVILSGNFLFLLIFHKKFKESFGNVFFTCGQSVVFVVLFMTFAWKLFECVVSKKALYVIIILCISAQAGYLVIRLLYVENGIKKGKYKGDRYKRGDPAKASGPIAVTFVLCRIFGPRLSGDQWVYLAGILVLFTGYVFLAGGWDGWIIYYHFKKLSPQEQDLILGKDEEEDRRKPKKKRSVVNINQLGKKD